MGTRSNTIVYDGADKLVNIYRQYDGYPSGHGAELAQFLIPITMVNGMGAGADPGTAANGAGCLAAQLIKHLKDGPGGIYIDNPKARDNDFTYEIHADTFKPEQGIEVKVFSGRKKLFTGGPEQFTKFCKEFEE